MLEIESGGNLKNPRDKIRVAGIQARLGNRKEALSLLERACAEHAGDMVFINIEPSFDSIRAEPRFQALVRKVGFPSQA